MKSIFSYNTSIGKVNVVEEDGFLTYVSISENFVIEDATIKETTLIKETIGQINDFLAGRRREFDLPLLPKGTEFQKKVWRELQNIPYGTTCSYKDIAEKIGSPKAARAVGRANNKNPIILIIPCHRVVGSDGRLVGYGAGLELKERLLALEKNN
ncbi:methylated-DNA-protein-cysteinemethyltransferase [Clostridium bornimense]|uniref:Methylated-DNA--protein-cysteine methyltransferase n=1 Tax=Clostridium bornimense TaxID=1216932 RepID=W6S1P6_9CLOT|nr:methylated-DNA--[protein]-cysteine S-methyltransferase [Clostridium bornimense]CDM68217.1 methylated-DNA-protein-cysteinemethyltransferase [Clostridium bornimense]